jgi:hypothetical protein
MNVLHMLTPSEQYQRKKFMDMESRKWVWAVWKIFLPPPQSHPSDSSVRIFVWQVSDRYRNICERVPNLFHFSVIINETE